jgi:hypothetical protein
MQTPQNLSGLQVLGDLSCFVVQSVRYVHTDACIRMSAKLPLINLNKPISSTLVFDLKLALRRFGAFRLAVAPETTQDCPDVVIENAG